MPPKFSESSFLFTHDERIPEHEETYPGFGLRDDKKWHLDGFDIFADESYPLANDIDTQEDAEFLATARLRFLEVRQPSIESGGQGYSGIQDQVLIVAPGLIIGSRYNPPKSELFGNSPERP